jgi:hypothetical protein
MARPAEARFTRSDAVGGVGVGCGVGCDVGAS